VIVAAAFLVITGKYAYADLSGSSTKVLGVGRIQSDPITDSTAPSEKLILSTDDCSTKAVGSSDLAIPINRTNPVDLQAEEQAVQQVDSTQTNALAPAQESSTPAATVSTPEPVQQKDTQTDQSTQSTQSTSTATATKSTQSSDSSSSAKWQTGLASAYGPDNAGANTATGEQLTDTSMGVAVPISQSYLLGKTIEIKYGSTVITTVINDTGGFGGDRVLDLQPGIWKAFGFSNEYTWGVRTVQYRILN